MRAYIGLGGNLGDREATLRAAVELLAAEPGIAVAAVSSFVETEPWGYADQPWFLNAVCAVETELGPRELLGRLLAIEQRLGRSRDDGLRFGPRSIDLDLLVHGELTVREPGLEVPQRRSDDAGSYLELVVSASKSMVPMSRQEILDLALRELAEFFPVVREAKLLKAAVVKEVRATFSVTPGLDAHRPGPVTAWPRLFLAGDWIATGWPSTMEGAVRSGYLAAEALTKADGNPQKYLRPDLPAQGLMRLFQ